MEIRRRQPKYLRLSLYREPPRPDLSLEIVLRGVVDRLKCLQAFHNQDDPGAAVDGFIPSSTKHIDQDSYHRDQSSHFLLRAICSENDTYFDWFVANEVNLFGYKLTLEDAASLLAFCKRHSLDFDIVSDAELECYREDLLICQESHDAVECHFKVPFTVVPDLVAKRSIFLRAGYAFVPFSSVSSLLRHQFSCDLSTFESLFLQFYLFKISESFICF